MRVDWLLVAASLIAVGSVDIDVAVSTATPFHLPSLAFSLLKAKAIKEFTGGYGEEWAAVVLDYTYSVPLSLRLLQTAGDSLVICMYEGCPTQEINSRLSAKDLSESLATILKTLPFSNVFLLSTAELFPQHIAISLLASSSYLFSHRTVINSASDYLTAVNIVGKIVKPAGTNLGLLLLDKVSGGNILTALKEYKLLGEGFAYLSLQESVWGVLDSGDAEGLICVGDKELAETRSREEFETELLKSQISVLERAENEGIALPELQAWLASTYHGKSRNATATILNIQQGSPTLVPISSLLFPVNSSSFPTLTQALLPVSVNNDGHDFNGFFLPQVVVINRGFMVGYSEVNNRSDLLPNFQVQVNSVGYGAVAFNTDWAVAQIEKNPTAVGLAHHPVALSQNVMGVTEAFNKLHMQIPVVTLSGSTTLSDLRTYPMFLRTNASGRYIILAMIRFFNLFGWRRTAFLTSPSNEDLNVLETFKNTSQSYNINITNSHTTLPFTFEDAQEELNQTIAEILSSNTRIVVISHPNSNLIIERMYDLGARAGDYLLILVYGLSYTYFAGNGEEYYKRRVVGKGAISLMDKLFVGEVGRKVINELSAVDGDNYYSFGCIFYDCSMLVAHALDYMIARGLHFERGTELVNAMRTTRFTGCIGRVQIESGTNDNIPGDQSILNMHYNEGNDTMELFTVASYTPDRAVMFTFTGDLEWPNGLSYFPDSWEMDSDCPYLEKDIMDFPKGQMVGFEACFIFSSIAGLTAAVIWRKWWRVPFPELTAEAFISIEDVLILISIPFDFLQLSAVAPDFNITSFTQNILSSTSFQLEPFINFTHGVFWGLEIAVFVMVLVYVLIFIMKILGIDQKLRKWDCCSFIDYWVDLLLPTLGNVLFLPIISTLLSTFNCYRSVGDNYTDSFLNRDCAEQCWTGKHLYYVCIAAICLVIYTPIAVFTRPLWQYTQPNLHLQALPLYLMFKSVLQMFLISASVTLKFAYQKIYALVYLSLISLYLCFLLKCPAFNYPRASLWHFLIVVALWLYAIAGLLHWYLPSISPLILFYTLGGLYICLAGVGLLLQFFRHKYRSLLKRKKDIDRSDIIKFAFTFGNLAEKHLANFRAKQRAAQLADPGAITLFIST